MARADCPECGGSGWKTVESQGPAGAVREAVLCACTREGREDSLYDRARIPKKYRRCDFANFDTDLQFDNPAAETWNRSLRQAKLLVEGFVREYPGGRDHGLLLMGTPGLGKTHLGVAALVELLKRGHQGLFCEYATLLKEIQGTYNAVSQTSELQLLDPLVKVEILLLDDLGATKPSDWVREMVGYILNTRYNENRATLLTTNYLDREDAAPVRMVTGQMHKVTPDSLADRIGERTRSRLYEMCRTILIVAPDYRREVRNASSFRA